MIWFSRYGPLPVPSGRETESALAHKLLECVLSREGIPNRVGKDALGRPYLPERPDRYVSLCHCEGLVACALDSLPVGIDAERIRPFNPAVAARVCSGEELSMLYAHPDRNRTFFRLWALKESYGKALGVGLAYPLREANFRLGNEVHSNLAGYRFTLLETIPGYVVAECRKMLSGAADEPFISDNQGTEIIYE